MQTPARQTSTSVSPLETMLTAATSHSPVRGGFLTAAICVCQPPAPPYRTRQTWFLTKLLPQAGPP